MYARLQAVCIWLLAVYIWLQAHAFFQQCEVPLDFAALATTPPPPLLPPPPPPLVTADSVVNAQLAARDLEPGDRRELIGLQAHTPWTAVVGEGEVIVLATPALSWVDEGSGSLTFTTTPSLRLRLALAPTPTPKGLGLRA